MTVEPDHAAAPATFTRRQLLGAGAATAAALVLTGCGGDGDDGASPTTSSSTSTSRPEPADGSTSTTFHETQPPGTPDHTVFTAEDFAALGVCAVTPEQTAGPFPSPTVWERRDLREGHPGHRLRIGVQVVDEACAPLADAMVSVWHCDVDGDYSAYVDGASSDDAGPGTTFMRGTQSTNAEGIVEIHSIYPGWYPGRAVHIHAEVTAYDGRKVTTQLYFDDDQSKRIFATAPYRGDQDTLNSQDTIAGDPAAQGNQFHVSPDAAMEGSRALVVVGLAADPSVETTSPQPEPDADGSGGRGTDGADGADGQMGGPGGSTSGGEGGAGGTGGSGGTGRPGRPGGTTPMGPGTTPMGPGTSTTTTPDGPLPA